MTRNANILGGTTPINPSRLGLLGAVGTGSALSHVATTGMPFQIGALMDGTGMSLSQAGLFAFCQIGALSAGMILVAAVTGQMGPRRIAVFGALLAMIADLGLFLARGAPLALTFGTVAGLGFGLVFTATISGAATCRDADRVYAIGLGAALVIVTGVLAVVPLATAHWGTLGVFLVLSLLSLLSIPFFLGFSRQASSTAATVLAWRIAGARGLLFSWAIFSMGTSTVYVFAERIGRSIPLAPLDVGFILSAGVITGVAGTGLAAFVAERIDRRMALVLGLAGSGVACWMLGVANSYWSFAIGVFLFWIFTMFLYCFLLGSAAILDESGRLGSLGGGMERLGYAVGAWIGGLVAQHSGYAATGALACGLCAAGVVYGFPSLFRALNRKSSASR
jgi:MFS transporter, DHA1 family, inner membrane transport protein